MREQQFQEARLFAATFAARSAVRWDASVLTAMDCQWGDLEPIRLWSARLSADWPKVIDDRRVRLANRPNVSTLLAQVVIDHRA